VAEAAGRVAAARAAAERAGVPLVINARTDVYHVPGDPALRFAEAQRRARAYLDAGADCIFLFGALDVPTMTRLAAEIRAPVNVVGRPGMPAASELEAAGVARISIAAGLSLATYGFVRDAALKLRESGDFGGFAGNFTRAEAQALAG
jgi:2-methylisocitrate lyase-like PEP mutase family enzyme